MYCTINDPEKNYKNKHALGPERIKRVNIQPEEVKTTLVTNKRINQLTLLNPKVHNTEEFLKRGKS